MPHPKVKISDDSGNTVAVDTSGASNALKVSLLATPTIDIGDVSLLLGGTAASVDEGNADSGTLRVTIADDDYHWGTKGTAADADGTAHGQLRYISDKANVVATNSGTGNTYLSTASTILVSAFSTTGDQYAEGNSGFLATGVRNDDLASLVSVDHDHAPFQVNDVGALYVTGESKQQTAVTDYGFSIMGEAKIIDGSALPNSVSEGNAGRLAMSRAGVAYTCLTSDAGASDLGTTIATHLSEIESAVETIEGAIGGTEMQVDIVSAPTLTVNSHAVTNAGTFATQIDGDALTSLQLIDDAVAAEGEALGKGVLIQGDDGSDRQNLQLTGTGHLKISLQSTSSTASASSLYQADKNAYTEGCIGIVAKAKRSDTLANLTNVANDDWTSLQVNADGALYVEVASASHDITGMVSGANEDVGTSAEILRALGNVACKRVDIMASSANTGVIWVGGSTLTADLGIPLSPGDFYSIDVDGTSDIYVLAAVNGEDVYFNYFT